MFLRHTWPALLWAIFILALTLSPAPDLPKVSWLNIPYFDKIVHVVLFGVLYYLLMRGLMKQKGSADSYSQVVRQVVITVILYGALTEVLQIFLPTGRDGNVADWLADCIGAGISYLVYGRMQRQKSVSA
jgi:VanZ family protein